MSRIHLASWLPVNLHVDNNLDKSSQDFLALIDWFNLKQHVCSPTHRAGHILDLLITRDDDQLVTSVSIHDAAFSDHFIVNCALSMKKNVCLQRNKLFIVVFRILISIFQWHSRLFPHQWSAKWTRWSSCTLWFWAIWNI